MAQKRRSQLALQSADQTRSGQGQRCTMQGRGKGRGRQDSNNNNNNNARRPEPPVVVLRSLVSHVARRVPLRSRLRDSSGSGGGGGGGGGGGSSSSSDGRQQQQQRRAAAAATTTASLNFSSGGLGLGFSRGAASVYCSTETTIRDVSNRFPIFEPFAH